MEEDIVASSGVRKRIKVVKVDCFRVGVSEGWKNEIKRGGEEGSKQDRDNGEIDEDNKEKWDGPIPHIDRMREGRRE